jgi:hypothetical protein
MRAYTVKEKGPNNRWGSDFSRHRGIACRAGYRFSICTLESLPGPPTAAM